MSDEYLEKVMAKLAEDSGDQDSDTDPWLSGSSADYSTDSDEDQDSELASSAYEEPESASYSSSS